MPRHPKDPRPKLTAEQLAAFHEEVDAQAKEALGHIYRAISQNARIHPPEWDEMPGRSVL